MNTPSGKPFDPDDPELDPWADDPNAPKEPSFSLPAPDQPSDDFYPHEDSELPDLPRGPSALLDPQLRGEIEFEILYQQTLSHLNRMSPPDAPSRRRRAIIAWLTRRPWVGTIARAFLIAALVAGIVYFDDWLAKIGLGMMTISLLISTPVAHRAARSRRTISTLFPHLPPRWHDVPDELRRELFKVSLAVSLDHDDLDPEHLAKVVHDLHRQATQ